MFFSHFTAHYAANKHLIPQSIAAHIRRQAIARVTARWAAGRADNALDFSDLIKAIEDAIGGR